MSDFNVVMLSGRLVSDPELRFTPQGTPVASMRLASSRFYRDRLAEPSDKKAMKEKTLFITAESFGKLAESVSAYKKKGDPLLVRGRLQLSEWKGDDGRMRQTYRIQAEEIRFLYRGKKGNEGDELPVNRVSEALSGKSTGPSEPDAEEGDIAF